MEDTVADHYNSLRVQTLGERQRGPAAGLKKAHNQLKRGLLEDYARNASFLVDIGCGRGGDLLKWRAAGILRVLGIDISAAQVEEARDRARKMDPGPALYEFHETDANLGALEDVPDESADVVTSMFSLNYFWGSEQQARALLGRVSQMLREGGMFLGVCADGARVKALAVSSRAVTEAYSLHLHGDVSRSFGGAYTLTIRDTVLEGSTAPQEFAVHYDALCKLALEYNLVALPTARRAPSKLVDPLLREVSQINMSFGFVKNGQARISSGIIL